MVKPSTTTTKSVDEPMSAASSSSSVAPFVKKCYAMVDDESSNDIISWNDTNDCFVIWDMTQFTVRLLPVYFKHNNFSSFMRQLNIYGFRKMDTDKWVFANEGFLRGQKHLLKNISRKKASPAPERQRLPPEQNENIPNESPEKDENELWKNVENLKLDKITLSQELGVLRQRHENSKNELLSLRERLMEMEVSQQQMMSFLVMTVHYPGYFVKILQPKEKNLLIAREAKVVEEGSEEDDMVVQYQPDSIETSIPNLRPGLASEKTVESSVFTEADFMNDLLGKKLFPVGSETTLAIPDWTDDGSWEQFLLSSPFGESTEQAKKDGEENVDTEMDVELASLVTPLGTSQCVETEAKVRSNLQ